MRKVRDFSPNDAKGLAKCINESEGGWPGGITQGVNYTVQQVMEDYEHQVKLTWLIAVDENDQVTGVSTLHPHFEDENAAYLGFLNVSDAFRKKGYGKALLVESIKRVTALGYKRLFLGTWAGNLNAVPVYKRTGFYWRPDTNVRMENYFPTVLSMPIAQAFFKKHDWYYTYHRQIEIKPDEMKHRGLHVYELLWKKEKEFLRIVIDRESREPTLIETDKVLVECWVANPEPVLGLPLPVEWKIQNKDTTQPLDCKLAIKLPKGFHLLQSPPSEIIVKPSETIIIKGVIQSQVSVVPPPKDHTALTLKSQLSLGSIPIELETGLRVQHPIQISTVPTSIWCRPGDRLKIAIALKSNLKEGTQGTLFLRMPKGLRTKQKQFDVTIKPEGYSGIDVEAVVNPRLATIALPIKVYAELQIKGQTLRTRSETIFLHCLSTAGVLVTPFDENRRLQVHTETVHFSINLAKGAHIDHLVNKVTRREHIRSHCRDSIGPPFWPSEQMRTHFKYRIEQPGNGITRIVTWMKCQRYPGLVFSKTYLLAGNSPNLGIEYGFENTNPKKAYKIRIIMGSIPGLWDHIHVLPLKSGLLRDEFIEDEFFATDRELPKKRDEWEETWYCAERPHKGDITALLCDPSIFYEAIGRSFVDFKLQVPTLHPNKKITLPPVYLVTGPGTWHHIRRLWYQYYSKQPESPLPALQPYSAVNALIEDNPFLCEANTEMSIPVKIRHLIHRPLQGSVQFTVPKNWQILPQKKKIKDLKRDTPLSIPLKLSVRSKKTPDPDILSLHTKIATSLRDYHFDLPIILHRGSGSVSISRTREEELEIFLIDNGAYQLKIAPSFAGSIVAWINKETGTNFLKSNFPKAGPMLWFNPWYGGIRYDPSPSDRPTWFPTKLERESWSAKQIQRGNWEGVTVRVSPDKEEPKLKGFRLELQVLTQPKSNIVSLIGRVINRTQAPRQINHRLKIALPSEPPPSKLETVTPRASTTHRRRRSMTHAWPTSTQPLLGVEHAKDGVTLLFISKLGPKGELYQGDMGPDAIIFHAEDQLDVPARSTIERTSFLVVSKAPWKQAQAYAVLSELSM